MGDELARVPVNLNIGFALTIQSGGRPDRWNRNARSDRRKPARRDEGPKAGRRKRGLTRAPGKRGTRNSDTTHAKDGS